MRKQVLLDSHALLFAAADPSKLSIQTRQLLESEDCEIFVSVATLWELMLKAEKGKLRLGDDAAEELRSFCQQLRATILPVTGQHVYHIPKLHRLHKDPFDRMLLAQAQLEGLTLVTRDAVMLEYGMDTIW